MLIIVTDNRFGISTPFDEVHCDKPIAARAEGLGIKNKTINGNDVFASYDAIAEAMEYVRTTRKPFFLEARVSRLHGHSSASGANWVSNEVDCITEFEKHLQAKGLLTSDDFKKIREGYDTQASQDMQKVLKEPKPDPQTIFDHTFVDKEDAKNPWPRWLKRSD